jgi:hypothetical protein
MDSRMIEDLTTRVLESDEMQLVLDYVTRSPELRAALAHQTAGLAGDVAVGVRPPQRLIRRAVRLRHAFWWSTR